MPDQPAPVGPFPVAQQRIVRQGPTLKATVKSESTATSLKDLAIYAGVAFGVVAFFCLVIYALNKYEPFSGPGAVAITSLEPPEEIGFYLDYKYSFKREGNKVAALFLPKMLPHNDEIFIGATRKVIKQAYGKEVSASPTLVGKEIKFTNGRDTFYVLPFKEDTGEIHSLVIRQ
jgi:hypothetical protein